MEHDMQNTKSCDLVFDISFFRNTKSLHQHINFAQRKAPSLSFHRTCGRVCAVLRRQYRPMLSPPLQLCQTPAPRPPLVSTLMLGVYHFPNVRNCQLIII